MYTGVVAGTYKHTSNVPIVYTYYLVQVCTCSYVPKHDIYAWYLLYIHTRMDGVRTHLLDTAGGVALSAPDQGRTTHGILCRAGVLEANV